VLVAGDAAGLLDPWTREGISFAVRSGAMAGRLAAAGARQLSRRRVQESYRQWVDAALTPEMRASQVFLEAFENHPGLVHGILGHTLLGWAGFRHMSLGTTSSARLLSRSVLGPGARILAAVP
jgi:flavin-dependent dehydrogenase